MWEFDIYIHIFTHKHQKPEWSTDPHLYRLSIVSAKCWWLPKYQLFLSCWRQHANVHYSGVIMTPMASQITGVSIVCSIVCSAGTQMIYQSSALLALCEGNPPGTSGFPLKRPSDAENVSIWWRHHAFSFSRLWLESNGVIDNYMYDADHDVTFSMDKLNQLRRLVLVGGSEPLSKPMLGYCLLDPQEQTSMKFNHNSKLFIRENA